jgi:hypothetical protein
MATEENTAAQKPKKPELEIATVHSDESPALAEGGAQPEARPAPRVERDIAPPAKPKALLVIHGMGQQLRFETLDAIVNGLFEAETEINQELKPPRSLAVHVQLGTERMERIETALRASPDDPIRKVHVYEAYWSPLTEGAVSLRDVVAFLYRAGLNGLKNSKGKFSHWAFGEMRERRVPVQTLIFILIALAVVVALGVINTAIIAVPAARAPFKDMPKWLSDGLFSDLTDVFNAALIVLLGFGLLIGLSMVAHFLKAWRGIKWALGLASIAAFAASLFAIIAAAIAIPILVQRHGDAASEALLVPEYVRDLGQWTPYIVIGGVLIWAGYLLVRFALSVIVGWIRLFRRGARWGRVLASTIVVLLFVLMVWKLVEFALDVFGDTRASMEAKTRAGFFHAPVWLALIAVSAFVRSFLVQFVGDVAAYVESHTIDKFDALRSKIKETVCKTASAIYSQKSNGQDFDYDEIVVAGHSLGSVVAYDTLNRLILDGQGLGVEKRTRLLLTFGSPLDKTAFVFANQGKAKRLTKAREALAAVMQPLIDSQGVRAAIPWVNVYSPWDIISGSLDYYDDPDWKSKTNGPPHVVNLPDPQAATLLAAHVEYWRNPLIFRILHEALVR